MIVCLICSSSCLRHYCDNMQAALELQKLLNGAGDRDDGGGEEVKKIREIAEGRIIGRIFFCGCLFEKT